MEKKDKRWAVSQACKRPYLLKLMEGKGSERGFLEGCILRVSLQLFTQLLAKSTTCFKDLCLCGAGLGSRSFEGENELMFPISPSPYGPILCSQNKTPVQSGTLNKNVSTLFSSLALYS